VLADPLAPRVGGVRRGGRARGLPGAGAGAPALGASVLLRAGGGALGHVRVLLCGGRCVPPGYAPAGPPPAGKEGSAARLDWTGNHPRSRAGVRMSAITREQVAHLAKLAHIEMTEEELRSMAKE